MKNGAGKSCFTSLTGKWRVEKKGWRQKGRREKELGGKKRRGGEAKKFLQI